MTKNSSPTMTDFEKIWKDDVEGRNLEKAMGGLIFIGVDRVLKTNPGLSCTFADC